MKLFLKIITIITINLINGLGYIKGNIRRFKANREFIALPADNHNSKIADNHSFIPKKYRIPHISWNLINYTNSSKKDFMYFIHSYRAENVPENYVLAYCNYANENFPAYVKNENIVGTQFHPEKSGVIGLRLLENWIKEFVL